MRVIAEHRASIILYNALVAGKFTGKFLLPANVCPVVPTTLMKAKIDFEFVDINPETLCIQESELVRKVTEDQLVQGVLFVGTYGYGSSAEPLFKKLKERRPDLFIIDDRCLSRPQLDVSKWDSVADMKLFSTGYSKYVELGYGGYGFLKREMPYKQVALEFEATDHGKLQENFRIALESGEFKYEDSNWLGDTGEVIDVQDYFREISEQIEKVDRHKRAINEIYSSEIPRQLQLEPPLHDWRFNIRVANKEEVLSAIFNAELFASSHYQSLAGIFGPGLGTKAKTLHDGIVNLFNDFRFSEEDAAKAAQIVKKVAR